MQKAIDKLKLKINQLEKRLSKLEEVILIGESDDALLYKAKVIISGYENVSASLLQRRLVISYSRAARILDQLEKGGYVGPGEGSKPRAVLKKLVVRY